MKYPDKSSQHMIGTLPIQPEALFILFVLQQAGFEAYIVGGAVRDLILQSAKPGSPIKDADYDFTTNATPEQISELFPESFYENEFGTVSIAHEHLLEQMGVSVVFQPTEQPLSSRLIDVAQATKLHQSLSPSDSASSERNRIPAYEITTYRSQEVYEDFRRPKSLEWGETLTEDLTRRDFTINAMALQLDQAFLENVSQKWFSAPVVTQENRCIPVPPTAFTIIDKHSGLQDLESGIIRTVGTASERFAEDALRMLRAIRFSVQLNMEIEHSTYEAIEQNAQLIEHVSWERIRDEFLKMLGSNFPKEAVQILNDTALLGFILPELLAGKGVEQGGHHTTDVWTHSLDALASCPSSDPIVRLATLLHDVAKPQTYAMSGGKPTFYNHEVVGARIAKQVAERLKLSKKDIERIFLLVRHHMFYYQPHNTDAAIRRFMRKVGLQNIDDILDVREGDRLGSGARKTSWRLEEMKERMREQLHQPMDVTDLAINGHDLMNELGLKPGPQLGDILHDLFEQVMENPDLNTKEALLKLASQKIAS